MWDIVWVLLQGHRSVSVSRNFFLQAPQCPCFIRKWFHRDHCCQGRSKPGCRIVGSHTRWELTTWVDFQLCLHRLLMSVGCKSNHSGFLHVNCSNGGLRISSYWKHITNDYVIESRCQLCHCVTPRFLEHLTPTSSFCWTKSCNIFLTSVRRLVGFTVHTINLAVADRSRSASYNSSRGRIYDSHSRNNYCWWGPTVVTDFAHCTCCNVFKIQTMKPNYSTKMTFKGHSRSSAMWSFVRNCESRLHLFSDKNSHISLFISGLVSTFLSYVVSEIFNVEQWRALETWVSN